MLKFRLKNSFRKLGIPKRFVLKSNDSVFVSIIQKEGKIRTQKSTIDGFRSYGICYKDHPVRWHHYCSGLFYGFGYHSDGYCLVYKKKWHLYPAILTEKIRLKISSKWSERLHLEK